MEHLNEHRTVICAAASGQPRVVGWMWAVVGVQWLHVLLGIARFGAALHNALILVPSITPTSLGEQRRIGQAIGARSFTVLRPVAQAVIAWGVLLGTLGDSDDARRSYCGRRLLNFVRRVAARLLRAVRARPGVSDPSVPVRWGWAPRQPPVAIFILVAS